MPESAEVRLPGSLWHVTITLRGQPHDPAELALRLTDLAFAHGIGLSARYLPDTVELRYWDEGHDCRRVADNALGLWDAHRADIDLPPWAVVGLEVLDRHLFRRRFADAAGRQDVFTPGVGPMAGG